MKLDTGKLYKGMTPHEIASAVFSHCANNDEQECLKAVSYVPRKTYTMPDYDYVHWLERIGDTVLMAGMSFWMHFAFSSQCGCVSYARDDSDMMDESRKYFLEVNAIRYALKSICEKHGIDKQAVFKTTRIYLGDDVPVGPYDESKAEEWFNQLEQILLA